MPLVTLLTDFGLRDPFVGEMKGVLHALVPGLHTVDVSHGVERGNVREGAWILGKSWSVFPPGTCHLAVVDPGVGSERRAVVAAAAGHLFVGPDNGLLAPALRDAGAAEVREIAVRELDRVRRGTTFDGRDVFAPAAARLAAGRAVAEFGPEVHDPVPLAPFDPRPEPPGWSVEVVRVDVFGNVVTAAEESFLRAELGEEWRRARVRAGQEWLHGLCVAYDDVPEGEPMLSIGGSGTLEVSVSRGSAAERLGLRAGDRVLVAGPEV
jgi:S-adenosylmethionine hydrolase